MPGYDRWKTRSPDDDLEGIQEPTQEQQRADYEDEMQQTMTADYAEILRLYRKYHLREGEPLWKVFVRIGQELEGSARKERCPTCGHTDLVYSRLVDPWCSNPWHADAHLRKPRLQPKTERWEVGKNGWDASDEATREDI